MSEQPNEGGPAFPQYMSRTVGGALFFEKSGGMSLRDWFAGQALAGLGAAFIHAGWRNPNEYQLNVLAQSAYQAADAMLAARAPQAEGVK